MKPISIVLYCLRGRGPLKIVILWNVGEDQTYQFFSLTTILTGQYLYYLQQSFSLFLTFIDLAGSCFSIFLRGLQDQLIKSYSNILF
jgi:hypothetical protein